MSGKVTRRMPLPQGVGKMASPVRCRHCAKVYDLATVTIVTRETDWSAWHCPGCDQQVDDRGERGSTYQDYDRIERVTSGLDAYGLPIAGGTDVPA